MALVSRFSIARRMRLGLPRGRSALGSVDNESTMRARAVDATVPTADRATATRS